MKLSNTHRKILLVLPTSKEGAITTNEVAAAAKVSQGSAGARLSELAGHGHANKVTAPRGPGGATRWWRAAAAPALVQGTDQAQAGFTALGLLAALGCLALLMVGAVILHRLIPQVPAAAWMLMGLGAVLAVAAGFRDAQPAAPQTFTGPVPLALSRANAQRDRQEGVADHVIFAEPPRRCYGALADGPPMSIPRLRRDGVPLAPLDSGPARKVPVRGSVRGDLPPLRHETIHHLSPAAAPGTGLTTTTEVL